MKNFLNLQITLKINGSDFTINGMLDYSLIKKSQRSNSYIENYNRKIKLKLSKYLFGKTNVK